MKKIDKLFVKSYIGPFALTTAIVVFIFLMRFLMVYFDQFIGKNLGGDVFARVFFYFTLITLPTSLPLATLLATLMCFGNMGEHFELTAMKSAGIPITRLVMPTFILSFFVAVFSLFYNNYVNPWANLKGYSLLYDIKTTKLAFNIQEGIFYNDIPGYRIKVSEKLPDGMTMKDIIVYDHGTANGNKNVTLADSGKMYTINNDSYLVFEMFNGVSYTEGATFNTHTQMTRYGFQKNKMLFPLSSFGMNKTNEEDFKYHEYMKDFPQLNSTIDSLQGVVEEKVEIQSKAFKGMNTYTIPSYGVDSLRYRAIEPGIWVDSVLKVTEDRYSSADFYNNAKSKVQSQIMQVKSDYEFIKSIERSIWAADYERWARVASAFSILAMFLIGASLGAIINKGGFGMPVLISIAFFILYYILQQMCVKYAREGLINPTFGAWLPFLVLFSIGLVLMQRSKNI